ncbi:MAG: lipocalin family protein [Gemmatimonadales bacterium]|jgi:hypothetical protein
MGARHEFAAFLLTLLAGLALACGDGSVGPSASEITGSWQATSYEYVSVADPSTSVDLIADENWSVTLALASNGSYTLTQTPPGGGPQMSSGTWELDGDVFNVAPTGTQFRLQFDIVLSGNILRLTGADAEYEFVENQPEDAKLNMVFTR